ncbi:MAG: hypothetical protein QOD04_3150, partial [Pseudonocardiales bacterium]|nr:hypothetical protein [Pseudonocardiales bacterium]
MAGLGTLGILVLQAAAAASVIGFFARRPDRHWWRTRLAPAIGLAGLVAATILVIRKFSVLTRTSCVRRSRAQPASGGERPGVQCGDRLLGGR